MNTRTVVLLVAGIAGLASGPSALKAGAASVPPIEWSTLPFLFFGSAIALFLLLAFQVVLKKDKALCLGLMLSAVGTVYAVVSGSSAVLYALVSSRAGPSMFPILTVGLGMAAGLVVLKATFAVRILSEA
jgi:hypothetical protein